MATVAFGCAVRCPARAGGRLPRRLSRHKPITSSVIAAQAFEVRLKTAEYIVKSARDVVQHQEDGRLDARCPHWRDRSGTRGLRRRPALNHSPRGGGHGRVAVRPQGTHLPARNRAPRSRAGAYAGRAYAAADQGRAGRRHRQAGVAPAGSALPRPLRLPLLLGRRRTVGGGGLPHCSRSISAAGCGQRPRRLAGCQDRAPSSGSAPAQQRRDAWLRHRGHRRQHWPNRRLSVR